MDDSRRERRRARHARNTNTVVGAVGLAVTSIVSAQEPATKPLEEVLITGSRIARDGFDASTPVAVVTLRMPLESVDSACSLFSVPFGSCVMNVASTGASSVGNPDTSHSDDGRRR